MDVAVEWHDWVDAVTSGIVGVPDGVLRKVAELLKPASVVLTAGNGGSHALASHAAQALMKPGYAAGGGTAAVCLSDGVPTLTAHANDGGWETALADVAEPFLRHADEPVLWLFSSSGRSKNIVKLAEDGKRFGLPVVAFTGFDGGPLRELATISVHVDSKDYEVIEPVHDALLHRVQHHLRHVR